MMTFLKLLNFLLSKFNNPTVILTYHSISDGKTPISVSVRNFEMQMDLLEKCGVKVLTLGDFLTANGRSRKQLALLTFDDGFRDVFQNALPILKKYNFPAAVFINPSLLGQKAIFATREEDKERDICSLEELHELADNNFAIANHGYEHKQLSDLSEAEIISEYEKAGDFIKDNFKQNAFPDVFVFPKGAKNQKVKDYLKSRGAKVLDNRVNVYPDTSLLRFVLKLCGW